MKAKTLSSCILLLAVAAGQQLGSTAQASVTFSVTPSAVSNLYAGVITLQIGGLGAGETVQLDKFMDVNANGVIDAADVPVQSFRLTDGQASVCYDGTTTVTNINVPGDSNPTSGAITAQLSIASDITQEIIAQYLFRLSSPTNHFTALTNLFNVTNSGYAQSFTGAVQNSGTNVPNAVVMVTPGGGKHGSPFAGVMANSSGYYTLNLPGGAYSFYLFKSNFVANLSQAPLLTLTNGATFTTNLHFLIPATNSISGRLVDAANTNIGLPGNFMMCQTSDKKLMAGACYTGTNGAFTVPVIAGQWKVSPGKNLATEGYLGLSNDPQVDTTSGSVSNVTLALPKANALFYGTVLDSQGHPLTGLDISCQDNYNQYQQDYYTDGNGYFVASVVGGWDNDGWQLQVSGDSAPTNYLFSQPSFNQDGGTNLNAGQAVLVNFTAVLATNHISGWLKDAGGNPIANVGIWANATINGVDYSQNGVSTDSSGNYSLSVANGTWALGVNTCTDCSGGLPSNYFAPTNQSVVISNNNGTANFTTLSATNHISGSLKDNNGNPIAGVGIWASAMIDGVNYNQGAMGTDANGNYSFNVINGTWTVNVSSGGDNNPLPANDLCPASQTLVISNNNGTANFTALLTSNHISGWLKDNSGAPIVGVMVWASANINSVDYSQFAATDLNGNYSLGVINGSWMLGVQQGGGNQSLPGNYLAPASQSVVISNNNVTANITVLFTPNHISGWLKDNSGNPFAGVGVWARATINGVYYQLEAVDTDANGNYSLNVANGTWSVALLQGTESDTLPGNYLCPSSQSVDIASNNSTVNFTTLLATSQITGTVQDSNSDPIGGVGVWASATINGQGYGQYVDTDGNGNYSLSAANGSWTVGLQDGGCSDSLDGILGSGNCQYPDNQNVPINNNTGTANFTVQLLGSPVYDVVDYYVVKLEAFLQVDPVNFVLNTSSGPFTAYLGLVQSAPDAVPFASVYLPTGGERPLPWGRNGLELEYQESFPSQALIDAAYPPGNYSFGLYAVDDDVQYPTLSMPSAAYPNPPHVSNFAAAQAINPQSPFTLQWDAISGATTDDAIWVFAVDAGGNVVFSTPKPSTDRPHALPATATSVLIPANTFQTGQAYTGWITYYRSTSVNTSAYPAGVGGVPGMTGVAAATALPLALASTSSRPRLDQAGRLSGTQFHFQLSGTVGQNYTVQVSTNLASANWSTLVITNLSASPVFIQDNQATSQQRFYRVKVGL